uniref:Uncharacterized protein n=1 Tax=Aegilops tauschii subsp. strangulata TaxID=200361 RepID=A0A453QKU4_AEGTS
TSHIALLLSAFSFQLRPTPHFVSLLPMASASLKKPTHIIIVLGLSTEFSRNKQQTMPVKT